MLSFRSIFEYYHFTSFLLLDITSKTLQVILSRDINKIFKFQLKSHKIRLISNNFHSWTSAHKKLDDEHSRKRRVLWIGECEVRGYVDTEYESKLAKCIIAKQRLVGGVPHPNTKISLGVPIVLYGYMLLAFINANSKTTNFLAFIFLMQNFCFNLSIRCGYE